MQWPDDAIARFENIVNQLEGETHLAQPDSDEGLLPILSLVGELSADLPDDPSIAAIVETIEATLHPLLEEARLFDDQSIESLQAAARSLSDHLLDLKSPPAKKHSKPSRFDFANALDELPSTAAPESPFVPPAAVPELALLGDPSPPSIDSDRLGEDQIAQFQKLASQFSGELLFAEIGSDEGLLPLYSLLNEFRTEFESSEFLQASIEPVLAKVDQLLENGGTFDDVAIALLTEFNFWLETAQSDMANGETPATFQPSNASETPEPLELGTPTSPEDAEDLAAQFSKFDTALDLNLEENEELLTEFHLEAVDHLGQIENAVLELEQDTTNPEAIDSMFRSFHTIKGVAGFLNLVPVNRLAHEIESLMDLVRSEKLPIFTGVIDLVLESKDALSRQIDQISTALTTGTPPTEVIPVSALMVRARWAMEGAEHYAQQMGAAYEPPQSGDSENAAPKVSASPKRNAPESASIRVSTEKLDSLMDSVGEWVIVQSQLKESTKSFAADSDALRRHFTQLDRISKELQRTTLSLRLVPIKPTFQKMGRMVRDLSAQVGKNVALEISGDDTELDRNVVESIGDPLVHMIRNALDHGLESTEARVASGKSETGHISLKAYRRGSSIVIELSDDGGGIDAQRVLEKAIANGIVSEDQSLSNKEIYPLIFEPGFSTAEQVTDISGRGVGMDVVRKNIEKLRGKIEIESELGKGSTFKILLPLTMAIVDGLVVKVGADRFILPTSSVKVALRPDADSLGRIQGDQEILTIREKVFPLFRLHRHFQIPNAETDPEKATVVIVETDGQPFGLMVDDLISKQEVVIKSLGTMMNNIPGVSGGAILGDGNIALILDTTTLASFD